MNGVTTLRLKEDNLIKKSGLILIRPDLYMQMCWNGRQSGLKIRCKKLCEGSSPSICTKISLFEFILNGGYSNESQNVKIRENFNCLFGYYLYIFFQVLCSLRLIHQFKLIIMGSQRIIKTLSSKILVKIDSTVKKGL